MANNLVQVNIRLPAEAAERLKAVADRSGLKVAALVELMLVCYSNDSNLLQANKEVETAGQTLAARLEAIESRLDAIEGRSTTTAPVNPDDLPPINVAIAELKAAGFKPQAAANELNLRGYRTASGTPIQRGYAANMLATV